MTTLQDRLEEAEAGSRELDREVNFALGLVARPRTGFRVNVAPVTTSLDAALALAERALPGCCVLVGDYKGLANHTRWNGKGEIRATKGWCSFSLDDASASNYRIHAHTPALALCAAILRAAPAMKGEG